jgi:hypothetical protein
MAPDPMRYAVKRGDGRGREAGGRFQEGSAATRGGRPVRLMGGKQDFIYPASASR